MRRLLILGLPDENLSKTVRERQEAFASATGNRLALHFPVHITLRGPFWTDADQESLRDCLQRVCRRHSAFQVLLDGPVFVEPDLSWFQVTPTAPCFPVLRNIHNDLENEANRLICVDDVPSRFKVEGYRPHITLGWGTDISLQRTQPHLWKPANPAGTIERIGIGLYPARWPAAGTVEVVESFPLGEARAD